MPKFEWSLAVGARRVPCVCMRCGIAAEALPAIPSHQLLHPLNICFPFLLTKTPYLPSWGTSVPVEHATLGSPLVLRRTLLSVILVALTTITLIAVATTTSIAIHTIGIAGLHVRGPIQTVAKSIVPLLVSKICALDMPILFSIAFLIAFTPLADSPFVPLT